MLKRFFILPLFFLSIMVNAQELDSLRKAANEGDSTAMMKLVEAFEFGWGTESNLDSADYWLAVAAKARHPEALYLMGIRHVSGVYSQKNFAKGVELLQAAANKAHIGALLKLHEIYSDNGYDVGEGTASKYYYSKRKAYEFARKAESLGSKEGAYQAGMAFLNGPEPYNLDSAIYFLTIAGNKGYPEAQLLLGDMYMDPKKFSPVQVLSAMEWYRQANKNKRCTIEQKTLGDVGIHTCDQVFKQAHNLMMQGSFLLTEGSFRYILRE